MQRVSRTASLRHKLYCQFCTVTVSPVSDLYVQYIKTIMIMIYVYRITITYKRESGGRVQRVNIAYSISGTRGIPARRDPRLRLCVHYSGLLLCDGVGVGVWMYRNTPVMRAAAVWYEVVGGSETTAEAPNWYDYAIRGRRELCVHDGALRVGVSDASESYLGMDTPVMRGGSVTKRL